MDDTIVLDHLGRPCKTTEAFDAFAEEVDLARRMIGDDPRNVSLRLSSHLLEVQERLWQVKLLLKACKQLLPPDTDSDQAAAALQATVEFVRTTSDMFGECIGVGLVALERGHLWPCNVPTDLSASCSNASRTGHKLSVVTSDTTSQS
jgi:hypothetical protein